MNKEEDLSAKKREEGKASRKGEIWKKGGISGRRVGPPCPCRKKGLVNPKGMVQKEEAEVGEKSVHQGKKKCKTLGA